MAAFAPGSREQAWAGGLTFAVHLVLLALLVFGVSWQQQKIDTAAVAELWRELPAPAPLREEPPPPEAKPAPPPPLPKAAAGPLPKPEPAPKADIALKDRLESERRQKEQSAREAERKKLAAEKQREVMHQAELEKRKKAEAGALKLKQAAEAEARRLAAEQQLARDRLAAQEAAAARREVDKYLAGIQAKVRRLVHVPPSLQGNPEAEVVVTLLPGGEVLNVRIRRSSGNTAYDEAVERAVRRAQPFEVPAGEQFHRNFREFTMVFRPQS